MTKSPVETRLMNKAVDYLARYATSQHRLREVLGRFAMRKLDKHKPTKLPLPLTQPSHAAKRWDILMMTPLPRVRHAATASEGDQSLLFGSVFANTGLMTLLSMPRLMRLISTLQMVNYWLHSRFARRRRLGPFDCRQYGDEKNRQAFMQRQLGSLARGRFHHGD